MIARQFGLNEWRVPVVLRNGRCSALCSNLPSAGCYDLPLATPADVGARIAVLSFQKIAMHQVITVTESGGVEGEHDAGSIVKYVLSNIGSVLVLGSI